MADKVYQRTLTEFEQTVLLHDLLDIDEWINGMILGKINNCKKRAALAYRDVLKKEGAASVPVDDGEAAKALFARPDYKSRKQRDASDATIARLMGRPS